MGLRSLHASPWTTEQKEESMNKATRDRIIGIDVSRDCLDIYCLPDGHRLRLPNTDEDMRGSSIGAIRRRVGLF